MVRGLRFTLLVLIPMLTGAAPATRPASVPAEALPIDAQQEAALLRAAGQGFGVKRTPHFLVAYDSPKGMVDEFTARIEHTYQAIYRFCELNQIETKRPSRRLEAIFFNDRTTYDNYAAEIKFPSTGTFGVYYEPTNRSAFFNVYNEPEFLQLHADLMASRESLDRLMSAVSKMRDSSARVQIQFGDGRTKTLTRTQAQKEIESARRQLRTLDGRRSTYSERINRTVVQHEVAHQVLFNAGVHVRGAANPKWIVEGLACMFEPPPDSLGTGIATVNQLRLADFRKNVGGERSGRLDADDLLVAIKEDRIIDPRRLVGDSDLFNARGPRGLMMYATTWSLTHYLQRTRPDELSTYLQELSRRKPGTRASNAEELALFEKHFGTLNDDFIRRWGDCILKLAVRPAGR